MSYTNGLDKPTDYFNTVLYTGDGGSQNITGVGFSPNWVWLKGRNNANNHNLNDTVRGVNKQLYSDLTNAETTATTHLTAFDSDGFTLGNDGAVNGSSDTYVSWNWKESATAGFDIVSYTGNSSDGLTQQNISHSLSAVPQVIIIKNRTDATNWAVYHHKNTSAPETEIIYLNLTNATSDDSAFFGDTAPTSSVFTVGGDNGVNGNGDSMIAYCFAEKKGYSKFGSYVANGNASGGFVYTGFKIGWLMIKRTDSAAGWIIYDSKREGRNTENDYLLASSSSAEGTNNEIDLLSNGFKPREANRNELNVSGASYIYLAFAESPFVTSTGIPTTAR